MASYACDGCGLHYLEEQRARQHAEGCSGTFTGGYKCGTCGAVFEEPEACDTHLQECLPEDVISDISSTQKNHILLDAMEQIYERFKLWGANRKKQHWEEMGDLLHEGPSNARRRWNSLLYSYKRVKDNAGSKSSGRGRATREWPHAEQMGRILGDDPTIVPSYVQSSMPSEQQSTEVNMPSETSETSQSSPSEASGSGETPTTSKKTHSRMRNNSAMASYLKTKENYLKGKEERENKRLETEQKRLKVLEDIAESLAALRNRRPEWRTRRGGTRKSYDWKFMISKKYLRLLKQLRYLSSVQCT